MISQEDKNHIMAFMPVMLELEAMGRNPVKDLFGSNFDIEMIEANYIAISRAREKNPEWYKVMSKLINKRMRKVKIV